MDEGCFGREVFEVATKVFSPGAAAHSLILSTEEVLNGVVCSVDDEDRVAVVVADDRMAKELPLDAVEGIDDRLEGVT